MCELNIKMCLIFLRMFEYCITVMLIASLMTEFSCIQSVNVWDGLEYVVKGFFNIGGEDKSDTRKRGRDFCKEISKCDRT